MKKDDIVQTIKRKRDVIEAMGYVVSPSGKSISFGDFSISIIMSKYGYDPEFGLNFFLRATRKNAPRDEWGNIPPFTKGFEYDWSPSNLRKFSKQSYQQLFDAYNRDPKNKLDLYFCALDKDMLENVTLITLKTFAQKLNLV